MNEFERKLYLKYRNIENMTQLLCLKLYRLRLFIQVNVLLFFLFSFFKTYFRNAQEEFKQPIKQLQYQFRSRNKATRVLDKILSCLQKESSVKESK